MENLLIHGLILGFSIAAPVGPIGVLCIRRTLEGGIMRGFISGLGTASADAVYGVIAAGGMTAISAFLVSQQSVLRLAGGLFLCYLAWSAWRALPVIEEEQPLESKHLWAAYGSAFFLTITNPMTILSFLAVFAGLGVSSTAGDYGAAASLVTGVFLGSAAWWLVLSGTTDLLRGRLNSKGLKIVNRVSAVIIGGSGLACIMAALR